MSIASAPDFFLTHVGDELVFNHGQPIQPNTDVPKKHILVVGGGVTGFTVGGSVMCFLTQLAHETSRLRGHY